MPLMDSASKRQDNVNRRKLVRIYGKINSLRHFDRLDS